MGFIGGRLGYRLLKKMSEGKLTDIGPEDMADEAPDGLLTYFGKDFYEEISGKVVADFGCGTGEQSVEIALNGAKKVIGIDIQDKYLRIAQNRANQKGVADKCVFVKTTEEKVDIVISKDAFEHFADPAVVLSAMKRIIKDNGYIYAVFGPTWYHPYGGHLFSVMPWAHLIFTEKAIFKWRSDFKNDQATTFGEIEGGLNKLTIRRFESIVEQEELKFDLFETLPIRGMKILNNRLFREFGTSIVRCRMVPGNISAPM
jgi:SAM-dependent methyltransferase